jgi:hypothetical protein
MPIAHLYLSKGNLMGKGLYYCDAKQLSLGFSDENKGAGGVIF